MNVLLENEISNQCKQRRTFAIISHPDVGKTTLTEKLLLYSGMIRTAGMVRARKGGRATSSDWMALEQERGISISASAMQFEYKGTVINVLDTPGHQDFSEDTYRTLTAADCAVMVLDAAKGVEVQTRKLFAVCRTRQIPILTFINKMDLPAKEPLSLLHELEEVLGIHAVPINWPIGSGKDFKGVVNCQSQEVLMFSNRESRGSLKTVSTSCQFSEFEQTAHVALARGLREELELLSIAGNEYSTKAFLEGSVTPVFFGSALTNFGLEPFFDSFIEIAPPPRKTKAVTLEGNEIFVSPTDNYFSGFIFKIQANMNPRHRDSMAYVRVCSGRFEREMEVKHHRTSKDVHLTRSYSLFAKDRNTVEEAYPGDVIGVSNPGVFAIGDTISTIGGFNFPPMPTFAPELVARIRPVDVMRLKSFDKGLAQLTSEGAIQVLFPYPDVGSPPYIAAVGRLQFDVIQYRLKDEYGVSTEFNMLPFSHCAFLIGDPQTFKKTQNSALAKDKTGNVLVLFTGEWEKRYSAEQNPNHSFRDVVA